MPKVLIGVVTHGKQRYCLDEFLDSLNAQAMKADVLFVVNHGESAYASLIKSKGFEAVEDPNPETTRIGKIVSGRKYLRKYALDNDYDYLMFVDSDVMLPPHAVNVLVATKGDVISGAYLNAFELGGKTVIAPVLFKDLGDGQCQLFTYEGAAVPQVMEIGAAGLGCTLIKRKVLEQVDIRSFGNSESGGEDMAFYVDAREKGFDARANTYVRCIHRPFPKDDPRSKAYEWKKSVEVDEFDLKVKE